MTDYAGVKAWRKANPDKVNAQARRYRAKHPETNAKAKLKWRGANLEAIRAREAEGARRRRKADPEGNRRRSAEFLARRAAKKEAIAGRPKPDLCELCGEFHLRIVFDHCHAKGHFRGWLCDRCNKMLGLVRDSPELLRKLAGYLERNDGSAVNEETELAA